MSKSITELVKEAYNNACAKGFHENGGSEFGTALMLIVSELSEALEAHRENQIYIFDADDILNIEDDAEFKRTFEEELRGTVDEELADAVIRIFDTAGEYNIQLESVILAKMRYNSMREYKHGKSY